MTASIRRAAALVELGDGRCVHGHVDAGFEAVLDAYVENFRARQDLGSACAVEVEGRRVVDLWGGLADARTGRAWEPDTAAVIFSCSKGLLAICVHVLAERGRLDVDVPIAERWPGFGRNGKDTLTLRDVMSHRSGLAALDIDLTRQDVVVWERVVEAIESQTPASTPADGHTYHAMTYGWIVGEVIRRVTGSTPGRWFDCELARPLRLDTWIGLDPSSGADVAWMTAPLPDEDSDAARRSAAVAERDATIRRSLTMGGAFAFPADGDHVTFNDVDLRSAEIPAANGISSARSLARIYSACIVGTDAPALLDPATIDDATRVRSSGAQLTGLPDDGARWGTGFQLASPPSHPMLGPTSFGHAGAGGQLAFADTEHRVGFAYLSNQMGGYGDGRANALTAALARCL